MFGNGIALGSFLFGGKVGGRFDFGAGLLLAFGFLMVVMPFPGIDAFLFAGLGSDVAAGGGGFAVVVGPAFGVDSLFRSLVAGFGKGLPLCFS